MANKNSKITDFPSSGNFTDHEKITLFLGLIQIITNQDRIMKAMNIGNPEENEEFFNDDNYMLAGACYEILEHYGLPTEDDDDNDEE